MLRERFIVDGCVEAGHTNHSFGSRSERYLRVSNLLDPESAVADDQKRVFRFVHHRAPALATLSLMAAASENQRAGGFGVRGNHASFLVKTGSRRVVEVPDATKNQLIARIFLPQKTRTFSYAWASNHDGLQC